MSNAQIALAWVLQQPGITAPIIGASKIEHLEDLLKALEVKLRTDEIRALGEFISRMRCWDISKLVTGC